MSTPCNALPSYVRLVSHSGSWFRRWWLDKVLRISIKRNYYTIW